jgi:soluble lytic murein transglycosylase-like protein
MTEVQKKINRDQAFRELTRQPLTAEEARHALPDDWETTKPADLVDEIKRAAERHGVPVQLLARLLYQEGKFNEYDKLRQPLAMDAKGNNNKPIGYAQMTVNTLEELKRQATLRGDTKRRQELETYSLANREQSFDAAAEQLAHLYRHMGGSWPKAVASYNVGQDLKRWFDGANMDPQYFGGRSDKNNKPIPSDKWTKEVPAYLRFVLRGAAEDPTTGDMYSYQPSVQYRVRDRLHQRPIRSP